MVCQLNQKYPPTHTHTHTRCSPTKVDEAQNRAAKSAANFAAVDLVGVEKASRKAILACCSGVRHLYSPERVRQLVTAADLDSLMHVQVLGRQEADKHDAWCFAKLFNDGDDALVCWCWFF